MATKTLQFKVNPAASSPSFTFQNYANLVLPTNGVGESYPSQYSPAGTATVAIVPGGFGTLNACRFRVTANVLYAQWNPYNNSDPRWPSGRGFARQYAQSPAGWQFNTYDRLKFWIKFPTTDRSYKTDGQNDFGVGTYVKRVSNPDTGSDETGGNHYYHNTNIPPLGVWTQVILNMHPDHRRGDGGDVDPGLQVHPTGEAAYNYWDCLTRFYMGDSWSSPSAYPADYFLSNFVFYKEPAVENDLQVSVLCASYRASDNRMVLTWNRNKPDTTTKHEVRYLFSDIHTAGFNAAVVAPSGVIAPLNSGAGYNGMIWDNSTLPLSGKTQVYLAIRPQNSTLFSQVLVPLNVG